MAELMDEKEFMRRVDDFLARVSSWLEVFDADEVDYTPGDGMLTMEFPDGERYVLSRQAATTQLWYAAGARAWHYNWDESSGNWLDDKDGHELTTRLAETLSDKIGREVQFNR